MNRTLSPTSTGLRLVIAYGDASVYLQHVWSTLLEGREEDTRDSEDELPWDYVLGLLQVDPDSEEDDRAELAAAARQLHTMAGLPPIMSPRIEMRSKGGLESPSFRIEWTMHDGPGEQLDPTAFTGAWYSSRGRPDRILDLHSFKLLEGLKQPPPSDRDERFRWWGYLSAHAHSAQAARDKYLENEDVIVVEKIRPVFEAEEDGSVRVRPGKADDEEGTFTEAVERAAHAQDYYTAHGEGGRRTRYVTNETSREGVRQILSKPRLTREEAAEALESPEQFYDPEIFDLSEYADRVIGIGEPRYRANVVVTTSTDSQGEEPTVDSVTIQLHDDANPEAPPIEVDISDREVREEFRSKAEAAIASGQRMFFFDDKAVRADPAIAAGLANLPDPGLTVERPEHLKGQVLLIQENLDAVEYSEGDALQPPPEHFRPAWPRSMAPSAQPHPHQRDGYVYLTWWAASDSQPIRGGLLADDMGLGKTFQVCSLMAHLRDSDALRPSLVVAPASVLSNWEREIRQFLGIPDLRILNVLRDIPKGMEHACEDADVTLCSYETLARRDLELGRISWRLLACDEASKIKNPSTRISHAAKAMKAEVRVAMTGTPVEVSLDELWSIGDFFQPGLLSSLKDFRERFNNSEILENTSKRNAATAKLRSTLEPVLLRRLKTDLELGLPELHREVHSVPMSELQEQLYQLVTHQAQGGGSGAALAAATRRLQVCAHPFLLAPKAAQVADPVDTCPKLEKTLTILRDVQQRGEKALVFARWIPLQAMLAEIFRDQLDVRPVILNGGVDPKFRQAHIDEFSDRAGFQVMILSPRACGMGLNIVSANHVIHYTREWNPAIESQATDRAYRIRQERPVYVHYPIVEGPGFTSTEMRLDGLLREREVLRRDFLQPTDSMHVSAEELLGRDDGIRETRLEDVLPLVDGQSLVAALTGLEYEAVVELEQIAGQYDAWVADGEAYVVVRRGDLPSMDWNINVTHVIFLTAPTRTQKGQANKAATEALLPKDVIRRIENMGSSIAELLG